MWARETGWRGRDGMAAGHGLFLGGLVSPPVLCGGGRVVAHSCSAPQVYYLKRYFKQAKLID